MPEMRPIIARSTIRRTIINMANAAHDRLLVEGGETPVLIVPILTGAWRFAAEFVDSFGWPPGLTHVEFAKASSYGDGLESSGRIDWQLFPDERSIKGRTVILLDDIYDSGRTLTSARRIAQDLGASDVIACALFHKPGAAITDAEPPDIMGICLDPSTFAVGFGLDYRQGFRTLHDLHGMER